MTVINCWKPETKSVKNNNNGKKDFVRKFVTWTLFSITFIVLMIFVAINAKKSFGVIEELHKCETELVKIAQSNYFGTDYEFRIGGSEFMIELFPYGVTDNELYRAGGMRLIKTTWYDKKGEAIDIEYSIVPPPEYTY